RTYALALPAGMALIGFLRSAFSYNPYGLRLLFGPLSNFAWGRGKAALEDHEQARRYAFWIVGALFLFNLLVSVKFAMR
ncbi:MAG: hypothetical protein HYZ23_02830, partial [Chloroflexi bacterium]|nr:hypothetical protein [Chloroflexota bacterium]